MKLTLHHINLSTEDVDRMDRFYRDVLGLEQTTEGLPVLEKKKGYAGDVAFVSDGAIQMHLAQRDVHGGVCDRADREPGVAWAHRLSHR